MSVQICSVLAVLVVILFAFFGLRKGFILTLFSLVALIVALVGAVLVTNHLSANVAEWLTPHIQPSITSMVEKALPDEITNANLSTDQLQQVLQNTTFPLGLRTLINQLLEELPSLNAQSIVEDLSASLAAKIASLVAKVLVFLVSFVIILVLWRLVGRALNLVAKLPGIHLLNRLGGVLLGAIRGGIIVIIALWLLRLVGLLTQDQIDGSSVLSFFQSFSPF